MDIFFSALVALVLGGALGFLLSRQQEAAAKAALATDLALARQREETLRQQNADRMAEIAALQEQLKLWFENTATRVLQATSEQSRQQLDGILSPVRERLEGFQKKVEEVYGKEAEQRITLKTQIELLNQANQNLSADAGNLAKALKGDSQKRGQWGEMILDNVLRLSGLKEGVDYITQGRGLDLKGEEGERQKPDVIVTLSGGQQVVVDSKLSLVAYADWTAAAPGSPEQDRAAQALKAGVRQHIKELSAKKYQNNGKLLAQPYVLMFVPIESALATVLDLDRDLTAHAWSQRVALVGPTTLLLTLNIIHATLQLERREHNAADIAREAADLYDKIRLVAESLNDMDKHLTNARKAHTEAVNRLAAGRGNVLTRVESFRARGITVDKPIPALRQDGEEVPLPDLSPAG